MSAPLVIGLDLGTGGARAVVARANDGAVLARGGADLTTAEAPGPTADGRHEQDPAGWWRAARDAVAAALTALDRDHPGDRRALAALCVDGTSGSLVGLERSGAPTTAGLMYDDARGAAVIDALRDAAGGDAAPHPALSPSSALARAWWLARHEPATWEGTARLVHQADWIAGRLTGRQGRADASNALKLGADPERGAWLPWLTRLPGLSERLPELVTPGDDLGLLDPAVVDGLGLPPTLRVIAGVTDGTAAALASGAGHPGEDATTLGTTLVFKRLADAPVRDPTGLVYAHALPGGRWLPGAASNVGAGWIRQRFPDADPEAMDRAALSHVDAAPPCYPLHGTGERFPLAAPDARALPDPLPADPAAAWAACLVGTAHVERLGYAALDRVTGRPAGDAPVHATGGGSRSDLWLQLRADACGRPVRRPAEPGSAFGAALIAAATVHHGDLGAAADAMVRREHEVLPRPSRRGFHDEYHGRLVEALRARGWLSAPPAAESPP